MKYPIKNMYLDPETLAILAPMSREASEFVRLLIKSSKLNTNEKSRELAKRELDLFIEKIMEA